jgi:hypothetical protein
MEIPQTWMRLASVSPGMCKTLHTPPFMCADDCDFIVLLQLVARHRR